MKELTLQSMILTGLRSQGWYATKTSDRFIAGKPDLRIGHDDFGQMDVELKVVHGPIDREVATGLTKIQLVTIQRMNAHGMAAVCLVYSTHIGGFYCANLLRAVLPQIGHCVLKLPKPVVIDGPELFSTAMEYLNGLGHNPIRRATSPIPRRKP